MTDWSQLSSYLQPHIISVALCAARLLPIAFLCPLLGGQAAPMTVRLGITLALSLGVHMAGGVNAVGVDSAWALFGAALKEVTLGMVIGLLASLPFDAARTGGRFIDLFRGSSAEAANPASGTRESATGDGLYQLLVTLVITGGFFPLVLGSIVRSFRWVPLGTFTPNESVALEVGRLVGVAFATGLAIGGPIAAGCLLVDWFLGLMARGAPQVQISELSTPLRILGGGAVLWLGVGVLSERLLQFVASQQGAIAAVLGAPQ